MSTTNHAPAEPSANPLLDFNALPRFEDVRPEHVEPALDSLLAEAAGVIGRLEGAFAESAPTWATLVEPLEEVGDRLDRMWSPVGHLSAVCDTKPLREAYNAGLAKLTEFRAGLGQNEQLYQAYEALARSQEYATLDAAACASIDNALREFRLAGVGLEASAKDTFKRNASRLSELSSHFKENVLDATLAWRKHLTSSAAIAGLPDTARDLAEQAARREDLAGWLLTLDAPCYIAVVTYAADRALRREMYEAYVTRASDRGPNAGKFDNSGGMAEILALRHAQALALGFASYAGLSLERKMAPSTDEVVRFLGDLARRARPVAERELAELTAFARDADGIDTLEAWDIPYYAEKLRVARFDISAEELRQYFPAHRVIEGLFEVAARLYGVRIEAAGPVQTWHPDVEYYEVHDESSQALRGSFYLDLYARPHKRGGAWMDECIVRRREDDGALRAPVAYLTCNFTPPIDGRDALLTHEEVTTLFHEFGHGLHHLLTRVERPAVAGIRGVPWDAVELPSQFMENWCYEREALDLFSAHVDTGEPLPEALVNRLRAARTFQSGLKMLRQIEFALFDFRLHRDYDPAQGARVGDTLEQVRDEVAVVRAPEFNRFAHSFSHIFGGGYAAGYYSYKWAEALSSDAFSKFEERGIFDRETGREFASCILERGGSEDAMALFVRFRGREPSMEALLRHSGLTENAAGAARA